MNTTHTLIKTNATRYGWAHFTCARKHGHGLHLHSSGHIEAGTPCWSVVTHGIARDGSAWEEHCYFRQEHHARRWYEEITQ